MSPFIYALNIGTFATWLTVAGASTVACVVHISNPLPELISMGELMDADSTAEVDMSEPAQGSAPPADPTDEVTEEENAPEEQVAEAELPEVPEELAEMPEVAELEPLPEIPDFPQPAPKPVVVKPESTPKPKPVVARNTSGKAKQSTPGARKASSSGPSGAGTGSGAGNVTGSGSSQTGSARLGGGRFPKPHYPQRAIDRGIQGRVLVEFTVDDRGNILNAFVKSGVSDSSLNEEALKSVRRGKLPPGRGGERFVKPIVFRIP